VKAVSLCLMVMTLVVGTSDGKTTFTGKKRGNKAHPLQSTWECDVTPVVTHTAPDPTPTAPCGNIGGGGKVVRTPSTPTPTAPTPAVVPTEGGGGFGDLHFKSWLGDVYDFLVSTT
jgi:hypothetical protein